MEFILSYCHCKITQKLHNNRNRRLIVSIMISESLVMLLEANMDIKITLTFLLLSEIKAIY